MNLKDRLKQFLKTIPNAKGKIGMGETEFEEKIGITRSSVSKIGEGVSTTTLQKILKVYPNFNVDWLITGEGDMLKQPDVIAKTKDSIYFFEAKAGPSSKGLHKKDMNTVNEDMNAGKEDKSDTPSINETWLTDALIANRESAIANKEAAIANRITAENQRELIQMQKHKSGFNLDEISRIQDEEHTLVSVLQMKLAEFVARLGLFPSAEDATEEINNAFDVAMGGDKVKSSPGAVGTTDKRNP